VGLKDADYVAEPRWRSQPTTVTKPENLTSGDPKVSAQQAGKI